MHEVCCIYLKIDLFKSGVMKIPRVASENFARETTDTFVLREKLRGSRMNPACVLHEK